MDDFSLKFPPEKSFKGKHLGNKPGYFYGHGEDGIGYYPDDAALKKPKPIKISINDLFDLISSLPLLEPSIIEAAEMLHDATRDPSRAAFSAQGKKGKEP